MCILRQPSWGLTSSVGRNSTRNYRPGTSDKNSDLVVLLVFHLLTCLVAAGLCVAFSDIYYLI